MPCACKLQALRPLRAQPQRRQRAPAGAAGCRGAGPGTAIRARSPLFAAVASRWLRTKSATASVPRRNANNARRSSMRASCGWARGPPPARARPARAGSTGGRDGGVPQNRALDAGGDAPGGACDDAEPIGHAACWVQPAAAAAGRRSGRRRRRRAAAGGKPALQHTGRPWLSMNTQAPHEAQRRASGAGRPSEPPPPLPDRSPAAATRPPPPAGTARAPA